MTDWASFPARSFSEGEPVYRIHQTVNRPYWFNDDGGWRFDPPLTHRGAYGVCYLGMEPMASYVEVFGRTGTIPQESIDRRQLSELSIPRDLHLADVTDRKALGFGVNVAHSAAFDYGHSQQLSAVLYDASFDGIYYRVRHDPNVGLEAIALFGPPGQQPALFNPPKTTDIPIGLVTAATADFGLAVLPSIPLP